MRGKPGRIALWLGGWLAYWLGCSAQAQVFTDDFADRQLSTAPSGQITADNTTATVEAGEPRHGGKVGGHSLWISWIAPTNGIVSFETSNSRFDTLLSVYSLISTNSTNFSDLAAVADTDDTEGFDLESEVEFGVFAGQRYEIAVDGYYGATGQVSLEWQFKVLSNPPPVIVSLSSNQAVRIGDTISLTAVVSNAANAEFQWSFNGSELEATNTTLILPNFQAADVGRYWLSVIVEEEKFSSRSVELQVNSEGIPDTLARPKIFDSQETPLIGDDGSGSTALAPAAPLTADAGRVTAAGAGVVRGYIGTQIFDTTYATSDPLEPAHCGIVGGASYWLAYRPPADGTITLDTIGSTYDTVIEVYTYNGTLTGYGDLISLACDNDSVSPLGADRVVVAVTKQRQYFVAVDGVNGARGIARFNYSLDTNQPPQPPKLTGSPLPQTVAEGTTVVLQAPVSGSPPMRFTWAKDQTVVPGANAAALVLPGVTPADSADYSFSATNDFGGPVTATFSLKVLVPPQCNLMATPHGFSLTFATEIGQRYIIEQAASAEGPWQSWPNYYIGDGQPVNTFVANDGTRFYRVRVE